MRSTVTLLVLLLAYTRLSQADEPVVTTTKGKVQGITIPGIEVNQFLGIPYAKQSRFKEAVQYPAWSGIRNATKYGASCPQSQVYMREIENEEMSEDCLFLDVYTPSNATEASKLSVMVWIHGGGYTQGSGSIYSGVMLAAAQVVMVSINYRLGVLGFFSIPGTDIKGNFGMLDQIMALRWVKENIKNFGGDPNQVTVFGESAGASSISLLALSPLAKNLFKKAIMQSGSSMSNWASRIQDEEVSKNFSAALKCPKSPVDSMINCIKSKPVSDILAIQGKPMFQILVAPTVDKHFLPDEPRSLADAGKLHSIPVIIGVNVKEGDMFLSSFASPFNWTATGGMSKKNLEMCIRSALKSLPDAAQEAVVFEYTNYACSEKDCPLDNGRIASDFLSDIYFYGGADFEARARSQGARVYSYLYSYEGTVVGFPLPDWITVTHATEVGYVLGQPIAMWQNFTDNDRKVSQMMMMSWTNFAKYGDPNHDALGVTWPLFKATGPNATSYLNIDLQPSVGNLFNLHKNSFWNHLVPKLQSMKPKKCENKPDVSGSVSVTMSSVFLVVLVLSSTGLCS